MSDKDGIPILDLWVKYEEIAMHFNDLIMKIRTQALAAVAAIAAIVAVIARENDNGSFSWELMALVFTFLLVFWPAIWILDFKYYNRLLHGAVVAIKELEHLSKSQTCVHEINFSHRIEDAVAGVNSQVDNSLHKKKTFGRRWFYRIVAIGLSSGLIFSIFKSL